MTVVKQASRGRDQVGERFKFWLWTSEMVQWLKPLPRKLEVPSPVHALLGHRSPQVSREAIASCLESHLSLTLNFMPLLFNTNPMPPFPWLKRVGSQNSCVEGIRTLCTEQVYVQLRSFDLEYDSVA